MLFSVLISVYINEKPEILNRALESVWDFQTLLPNEIVLVKDGPLTDELEKVIIKWQNRLQEKFKIVSLTYNVGLGQALNEGIKYCSFELVARMDSDDISLPNRFQAQIPFIYGKKDVSVCSAWIEELSESGCVVSIKKLHSDYLKIKKQSKIRSPVNHAACVFRRDAIISIGGYPHQRIEDYALISLLLVKGHIIENIPEVLYQVRLDNNFYNRRGYEFFKGELQLLKYQIEIGFISIPVAIRNAFTRAVFRLSPNIIKRILYLILRS